MTDTLIEQTFTAGDKFRYTGNPGDDMLGGVIRSGSIGTIGSRTYPNDGSEANGPRVYAAFDAENVVHGGYADDDWYVSVANIERLSDPEPEPVAEAPTFAPGVRFEYTGNPWDDSLGFTVVRGSTGVILEPYDAGKHGPRWFVRFDHRPSESMPWVSERNIEPLAVVVDEPLAAAEAREAHAIERAVKAEQALEDLRAKVVEVARNQATEHDWCDVVDEALAGMGLLVEETTRVRATMIVEFNVKHTGELDEDKVCEAAETFYSDRLSIEYVDGWRVA